MPNTHAMMSLPSEEEASKCRVGNCSRSAPLADRGPTGVPITWRGGEEIRMGGVQDTERIMQGQENWPGLACRRHAGQRFLSKSRRSRRRHPPCLTIRPHGGLLSSVAAHYGCRTLAPRLPACVSTTPWCSPTTWTSFSHATPAPS